VLGFLANAAWIVFGWPLPFRLWILSATVAGALVALFIRYVMRKDREEPWKRPILAGAGCAGLIAALVAVPALQGVASSSNDEGAKAAQAAPPDTLPAQSPSSSPSGKLMTSELDFDDPVCEAFAIPRSLLPSLPKTKSDITAEWIYGHGGATLASPVLTLQGKNDDAVIITAMRVTEMERSAPPPDTVAIFPCGTGGGVMAVRHFELKMTDPPRVISRRGEVDPDGNREPAIKLPVKVSNSDPEIFVLKISGPPCFCAWNLELDWKSGGQRGTMTVSRPFGKTRSDTDDLRQYHQYSLEDGKWVKYS
jgi:hypothetical protein